MSSNPNVLIKVCNRKVNQESWEKMGIKDNAMLSKHAERNAWKLPFQEVRRGETFRLSEHHKREKSLSVTLFPGTEREKERGDSLSEETVHLTRRSSIKLKSCFGLAKRERRKRGREGEKDRETDEAM